MPSYPIVIQAGLSLPNANAANRVAIADMEPVIKTPFEPWADYDWTFGTDNPDLVDSVQGARLGRNISIPVSTPGTGYTEGIGPLSFTVTYASEASTNAPPTGFWVANSGGVASAYMMDPGNNVASVTSVVAVSTSGAGATFSPVLQAGATLASNYLSTAATVRAGLISPIIDSADVTLFGVFRVLRSGSTSQVLFGTAVNDANYVYGSMFYNDRSTPAYKLLTRTAASFTCDAPSGFASGGWMFVGTSHKADGTRLVYYGGQSGETTFNPAAQVKSLHSLYRMRVSIGNAHYQSGTYSASVSAAQFGKITGSCTVADFKKIEGRLRDRMNARGITLL